MLGCAGLTGSPPALADLFEFPQHKEAAPALAVAALISQTHRVTPRCAETKTSRSCLLVPSLDVLSLQFLQGKISL